MNHPLIRARSRSAVLVTAICTASVFVATILAATAATVRAEIVVTSTDPTAGVLQRPGE